MAIDGALLCGLTWPLDWWGPVLALAAVGAGVGVLGQTPGKYLLRIQVQRLDGRRLGLARGLARVVATLWLPVLMGLYVLWYKGFAALTHDIHKLAHPEVVPVPAKVLVIVTNSALALVYLAGLALAAVQRQKRAVHDFLVGSRVIYRLGPRGGPAPSRRGTAPAPEPPVQT
jgi:uncharacterized RDD family membrane protein YckC